MLKLTVDFGTLLIVELRRETPAGVRVPLDSSQEQNNDDSPRAEYERLCSGNQHLSFTEPKIKKTSLPYTLL